MRVRKLSSAGELSTLAGTGVAGFENGAGDVATFWTTLSDIDVDASGNVFVSDRMLVKHSEVYVEQNADRVGDYEPANTTVQP